jgi:hypothetical protein
MPHGWLFANGTDGHFGAYQVRDLVRQVLPDPYPSLTLRLVMPAALIASPGSTGVHMLIGHSSIAPMSGYAAGDDEVAQQRWRRYDPYRPEWR